jgi:uncharacterized protein YcbK (DUF882 family)
MSKRLITASFAIALAMVATPAVARSVDDDDDGPRYGRHRSYLSEHRTRRYEADSDDDERVERRARRHHATKRTRTRTRQAAKRERTPRQERTPGMAARSITGLSEAPGTARGCLQPAARTLLERIEATFGRVQIISTCRPGARIAGSGRISKHASGEAIDFNAPSGRKAELVRWLIANHKSGGTMTYSGMSHIHVDVGQHFVALGR